MESSSDSHLCVTGSITDRDPLTRARASIYQAKFRNKAHLLRERRNTFILMPDRKLAIRATRGTQGVDTDHHRFQPFPAHAATFATAAEARE